MLSVPLGAMLSMTLNDVLGRLTLIKFMAIPFCLGWTLIATASSFEQIIAGRMCTGLAVGR